MNIEGTDLEQLFLSLLQRKIKIYLKNKLYKEGRLLLFRQLHYHIELSIKNRKGDIKSFEIPIPFKTEEWRDDQLIYFDYRIEVLSNGNKELISMLKSLPKKGNSKFYDTILEIQYL